MDKDNEDHKIYPLYKHHCFCDYDLLYTAGFKGFAKDMLYDADCYTGFPSGIGNGIHHTAGNFPIPCEPCIVVGCRLGLGYVRCQGNGKSE